MTIQSGNREIILGRCCSIGGRECSVYQRSCRVFTSAIALIVGLSGCAATEKNVAPTYDQTSSQQLIPASCLSYFDGCNNCRRNPVNGIAACTRMACVTYAKPYCLDATKYDYQCDGDNEFTLWYGEYQADDQKLRLKDGQVMFSDRQMHTASVLNREPSASGERYSDGKLTLYTKSNGAFVELGEQRLYTNCQTR